jgi:hypothetical protein
MAHQHRRAFLVGVGGELGEYSGFADTRLARDETDTALAGSRIIES